MPEHIKGKIKPMECMFERALINMGFEVIKDGSKEPTDVNWLESPTFFTRVLRAKVEGKFIDTWVRFTYDKRTGDADFSVSYRDLAQYEDALAIKAEHDKAAEEQALALASLKAGPQLKVAFWDRIKLWRRD